MSSPTQTNTQEGQIVRTAAAALVKGRLVQLVDFTGEAKVQYPASDGVVCQYVTLEDCDSGASVNLLPLSSDRNIRIISSGTISGAVQVMCEAATGKIKSATGTNVYTIGYTEEDCVADQLALVRPYLTNIKPAVGAASSFTPSQVTLTDSSGGTAGTTLAATAGIYTLSVPIHWVSHGTGAEEIMTDYVFGHKFKILGISHITTVLGTGTSASQTITAEIGTTAVTSLSLNVTLATTTPLGVQVTGTPASAANTGSASANFSLLLSSGGTAFTAGDGVILVQVQNMDVADAIASEAAQLAHIKTDIAALKVITDAAGITS